MAYWIATDEAGYGPKLGPLVVAATLWETPQSADSVTAAFASFQDGLAFGPSERLRFADSKELFQSSKPETLRALELPLWGLLSPAILSGGVDNLAGLLQVICNAQFSGWSRQRWFANLASAPFPKLVDTNAFSQADIAELTSHPGGGPILQQVQAHVVDVEDFNLGCQRAGNKATFLSEATLSLIATLVDALADTDDDASLGATQQSEPTVHVICDRHGGRKRYASLIQQFFPDVIPQVLGESPALSRYRTQVGGLVVEFEFLPKADREVPVAFSSMVAKYLRERLMEAVNAFWAEHHAQPLRPTAGYPVDAQRFCQAIAPTARRLGLSPTTYIRTR